MTVNNPIDQRPLAARQSASEGNLQAVDLPVAPQQGADQGAAPLYRGSSVPAIRRQRSLTELQLRQAFNDHRGARADHSSSVAPGWLGGRGSPEPSEGAAHSPVLHPAREESHTRTTADRLRTPETPTAQAVDHGPEVQLDALEPLSISDTLPAVPDAELSDFLADVFDHSFADPGAFPSAPVHAEVSLSRDELLAHWNAWAEAGGTAGGNRTEAVRRMTSWLDGNDATATLDLTFLELTSLPDALPNALKVLNVSANQLTRLPDALPNSLQQLDVSSNQLTGLPDALPNALRVLNASANRLTQLPEALPNSLQQLDVSSNQLTRLPDALPSSLQVLNVHDNQLTHLPNSLPDALQNLDVSFNRLTHLPNSLPNSLQVLNVMVNLLTHLPDALPNSLRQLEVSHNRLTRLPENIITRLSGECAVVLEGNPLPRRVIDSLGAIMNAIGYQGPQFRFSMVNGRPAANVVRPLADAAAAWFKGYEHSAARQTWAAFQNEAGHDAFSGFLDYLGRTVNATSPQFRQATAEWLSHLAAHPQLRHDSFLISAGATESCEDRVSLTLNEMKKARLAADVQSGTYDQRVPDLITLARGMFRLDKLEKISRKKVESLHFVDEIEVYLAYQVKLRNRLELPIDTADMRYFDVSYVTPRDLDTAEKTVRDAEKIEFTDYLSADWAPWQAVLKNLEPGLYEKAQEQLHEVTETQFADRLTARLREACLEDDSDARRTSGPLVMADIKREIMGELTKTILQSRNFSDLLA